MKAINDLARHVEPMRPALEQAVCRVITSGWFVLGPEVAAFEQAYAKYCGVRHCVGVANGTDALELALRSLGIREGSRVLTVANAGGYSTAAIVAIGAIPVYTDVWPDSGLIDIDQAARLIGEGGIDALIVTHLYGLLADIVPLLQLAKQRDIPVIEDCAQAHGAELGETKAGAFADAGCFSFYPTKNLGALGDGGAIVTDRDDVRQRVMQLRQYGWESKYSATQAGGRNSRLDEMQAAVLRHMLPLLDSWNARRREIAARYSTRIRHIDVVPPPVRGPESVAHLYVVRVTDRIALQRHLAEAGIPSDIHYPVPDYQQPCWSAIRTDADTPVTAKLCGEVLTLPCFPEMTDVEVDKIIDRINNWR